MTLKTHDFERIVKKLGLKTRNSGDRLAWFEYEGKVITRTRRSNQMGDLPFSHAIRQQLKLNEDQMRDLLACPFGLPEYVEHLRSKGLI
jgi:hypothetical protein